MSEVRKMPQYRCHKVVGALKIAKAEYDGNEIRLEFKEDGFAPIIIDGDAVHRFTKAIGGDHGYLVSYRGGYRSWSPSKAFEDGYTRID